MNYCNKLKKLLIISSFLLVINACISEPVEPKWTVYIKSTSIEPVSISTFYKGEVKTTENLTQGERGLHCSYYEGNFGGYTLTGCSFDSIKIEYDNNKGYLASINYITNFEFTPNDGFWGHGLKYQQAENSSTYEFILTDQDYENAHELP